MERAAYFAGEKRPHLHVEIGNYWTMRSKTIFPTDPQHQSGWEKACWHYKKALSIEGTKSLRDRIIKYVWQFYPDRKIVKEAFL